MSTAKGNNALQLLDIARCNGDWEAIPELCRKVIKHAPGRRCLAITAQTEARLQQFLPPPPPESSPSTIVSYIVSLDALQDPLEDGLHKAPRQLPKLPTPAGGGWSPAITREDLVQARVAIASICVLKGEWNEALRIIPHEREVEDWDGGPGGGFKGEHFDIVRVKSLVLKGIALSHTNPSDLSLPLLLYRTATRLATTLSATRRDSPSLLLWTERALAHYALAAYRCWLDNNAPDVPHPPLTTVPVTPRQVSSRPGTVQTTLVYPAPRGAKEEEEEEEAQVGVAIGKSLVDEATVAIAFRTFHTFISRFGQTKPRPGTGKSNATKPSTGIPSTGRPGTGRPSTAKTNFASAHIGSEPGKERERQEVFRYFFRFLSLLLLPSHHPQSPAPRNLPSGSSSPWEEKKSPIMSNGSNYSSTGWGEKAGSTSELKDELKVVEGIYEGYLLKNLEFPEAIEYHEPIGEWVDIIAENWHMAGGSAEDAPAIVEILYRASAKTFLSPRILRHLFFALSAMGNLLEAEMALNTYLDLIGKGKDRLSKGSTEVDFDSDKEILETAAEGIRFLCKHIGAGRKGMNLAEKCEKWVDEWHIRDEEVLSEVYRGIGIANAFWALQTTEGDDRDAILRSAERAFKRGLRYNSTDVDAWYGLSLVYVKLRDTVSAMESVDKGLQALTHEIFEGDYRRRAIPMLHLLALLMSATEEYDSAQHACSKALEILGDHAQSLKIGEKESALQVQMTQLSLVEVTEGFDEAMAMTEKLLNLYSRAFNGIPRREFGPVGSFDASKLSVRIRTSNSSRPSTAKRLSRLFGRNKKDSLSTPSLNLPSLAGEPPQSPNVLRKSSLASRHSLMKRRPKSEAESLDTPFAPPKIQITDTNGGTSPAEIPQEKRRVLRRNSVSGGTIRRMRSLGSRRSSSSSIRSGLRKRGEIPPTPSLPMSSAGVSSISTGVSTSNGPLGSSRGPAQPQLFHILKSKLHYSQPEEDAILQSPPSSSPVPNGDSNNNQSHINGAGAKAADIPNNLPQSKLPHPISALGGTIADRNPGSIRRPIQVPEPKLKEEDEKRRAIAILRSVWLFVAALYRRGKFFNDATMAIDEATGLVGFDGEGSQEVLAERGYLALSQDKKSEASELFEAALMIDVDYPPAIIGLCEILLELPPTAQVPLPQAWIIGKNRALALLQSLTSSPRGWNLPEAWFALSRAFELEKDVKNAKSALWKVIELEDSRGVRSFTELPRML
ncbi:hypothetical protein L873DRAFT_1802499 [Choiromyces venosus 120613-1]|uniref:TPR-like protein n=1 Tax=Choiromyces venosus 120613-1 TaxID=1336337 RepID=A0A3N4JUQ6_9PEZI|nr:hypothetical protein L873DRAFT_1802499 [Choiromyces venosus 120613-1]